MSKSREWLGKALFESALIIFSILFALWVNDWKEERDHRNLAQQALANFEREILNNQATVKRQLEYHQRLQESLRAVLENPGRIRTLEQLWQETQWKGLSPPVFLDTAWQTAVATRALTYLDYQTVSVLSEIYSTQKVMDKLVELFLPSFLASGVSDHQVLDAARQVSRILLDFTVQEKLLLTVYDRALQQIRKEKRPKPVT